MQERLLIRVGRIISSNITALLNAIENTAPEIKMNAAIKDIEGAINDVRAELGRSVATHHIAETRLRDENKRHSQLTEKIEMAINNQRDDLAERAIAEQMDIETQRPIMEATIRDCCLREKELEGYITALLAKKCEMQAAMKSFDPAYTADTRAVSSPETFDIETKNATDRRVENATATFNSALEKATGVGGALHMDDRKTAAQLSEIDEIDRKHRIQERLSRIKNKVKS